MFRPLMVLPILLAVACAPDWSPAESPKHIQVIYGQSHHDVAFQGAAERPTADETNRLSAFIDRLAPGYGDRVTLSAATPLDRRRAATIAAGLRRQGISVVVVADATPPDRVRVSIGRYTALPPACPDWTRRPDGDQTNLTAANFGCANATNLSLMVADPGDLLRGRAAPGEDGEAAALPVQRYRAGKTRPLLDGDTQGGSAK